MLDTLRFILNDALNLGFAYGLLALGIFISYRLLDFADLTAEGSFTLGGAFVAALIFNGANPFLATLLSIVVGFVAGIITGLLHTKLKIPSLLSGIITMTALFSINMILMGIGKTGKFDSAVYLGNSKTIYDYIGIFKQKYLNIIIVNFLVITLATMFCYWLFGTEFGLSPVGHLTGHIGSSTIGVWQFLARFLGLPPWRQGYTNRSRRSETRSSRRRADWPSPSAPNFPTRRRPLR